MRLLAGVFGVLVILCLQGCGRHVTPVPQQLPQQLVTESWEIHQSESAVDVSWRGREIHIPVSSSGWFDVSAVAGVPVELVRTWQLITLLRESSQTTDLSQLRADVERHLECPVALEDVQSVALDVWMSAGRWDDLSQLQGSLRQPDLRKKNFVYLVSKAPSAEVAAKSLDEAMSEFPDDTELLRIRFAWNLGTFEDYLTESLEGLKDQTFFEELDMEGTGSQGSLFGESLKASIFNTTNVLAMSLFGYAADLNHIVSQQLEQIQYRLFAVRVLQKLMVDQRVDPRDPASNEVFARLPAMSRGAVLRFFDTPVARDGLGSPVALPMTEEKLGLDFDWDFRGFEWRKFIKGQLNLMNVWMIMRGPAAMEALLKTRGGIAFSRAIGVDRLRQAALAWPAPVKWTTLWLVAESLDGCVVRWIYIGVSAVKQATAEAR